MDFFHPSYISRLALCAGGVILMTKMVTKRRSKESTNVLSASFLAFFFMVGNISPIFELQFRGPRVFRIFANLLILMGTLIGTMGAVHLPATTLALTMGAATYALLRGFGLIWLMASSRLAYRTVAIIMALSALATYFVKRHRSLLYKYRDVLVLNLMASATFFVMFSMPSLRSMYMAFNYIPVDESIGAPRPPRLAFLNDDWPQDILTYVTIFCALLENFTGGLFYDESPPDESMQVPQIIEKTTNLNEEHVTNYIDFGSLTGPLQNLNCEEIQELAFKICIKLGFQIHNCLNQSEHLIMLLVNEVDPDIARLEKYRDKHIHDSTKRLHSRLLRNYANWCVATGVDSNLDKVHSTPSKTMQMITEMLIFLMVWGEAANLRHLPECLCFIFHKILFIYNAKNSPRSENRGSFLDKVITPMYNIISSAAKLPGDHESRLNYDDFNEFFWSPKCASYELYNAVVLSKEEAAEFGIAGSGSTASASENGLQILAASELSHARKTYLEVRSWLHPLLAMRRVFNWLLLTYTILSVIGFSNFLQWRMLFTLQVASFVFWEISFLDIVWTLLEVWVQPPEALREGPLIGCYMIRILGGFLILTYQSIYYQWAFTSGEEVAGRSPLNWWWQYIWLSLLSCSIYLVQCLMMFFPGLSDRILSSDNLLVQSVLYVFYPNSQLYVGKRTAVPQLHVMKYIAFWLPLLAFKLWFGYYYITYPMCTPTIQIYDDYMNFNKYSFFKTSLLIFLWWFPHFLVYCIDLSIWYAVWSSIVGGCKAVNTQVGEIRNQATFKQRFVEAPSMLVKFADLQSAGKTYAAWDMPSDFHLNTHTPNSVGLDSHGLTSDDIEEARAHRPNERTQLNLQHASSRGTYGTLPSASIMPSTASAPRSVVLDAKRELSEEDNRKLWIRFATLWNRFAERLRMLDEISDKEQDWVVMRELDILPAKYCMPLLITTGFVGTAVNIFQESSSNLSGKDVSNTEHVAAFNDFQARINSYPSLIPAVKECFWLTIFIVQNLLCDTDVTARNGLNTIAAEVQKMSVDEVWERFSSDHIQEVHARISNVAVLLAKQAHKREPVVAPQNTQKSNLALFSKDDQTLPAPSSVGTIKRSRSSELLSKAMMDSFSGGANSALKEIYRREDDPSYCFDELRDQLREELRKALQALLSATKEGLHPQSFAMNAKIREAVFGILSSGTAFFSEDIKASMQLNVFCASTSLKKLSSQLSTLLTTPATQIYVKSDEASRRINFFMSTLFMCFPAIKSIKRCRSHSTITPFYKEDVLLNREDLLKPREDGLTLLLYLQTLYKNDWDNFLERCKVSSEAELWTKVKFMEVRRWASLRAQTLYRTVEGIMTNEQALNMLEEIEGLSNEGSDKHEYFKFTYVVACQAYGEFKRTGNSKYKDIDNLLKRHANLRVAYIDCRESDPSRLSQKKVFYSVLIRALEKTKEIVEVYRIKLPGNPILGEGKPENQNHAIIFTRGRYLQAIDMNQDGYFEESLKMKNLLEEFDEDGKCAIVGFREHIFTGSVSSIANFMALQELSFVTLGQRVLCDPLCIRQHYGHPDVFDKFFVMTEGGMSKASKGINLSEDVFAGFNATIRGHTVKFVEYVCAGKGRDIGLQQTYLFEAKLAQGNAEQSLSRDVDRIFNRLDFFRMLSFYFGGIGHYLSNTLVMFCLVIIVYTMLGQAIYHEEGVNGRAILPEGVLQLSLAGMGILQTLPLFVTMTVEKSFRYACFEIAKLFLSGGPLYFIFQIQTKSYYFAQTIMAGGATYHATGRGFVTQHTRLSEVYRFFASSHIYLGFDLILALMIFGYYTKSTQYFGLTWSLWMAAGTFFFGPFWFNPLSFEWAQLADDFRDWWMWMEESLGSANQSWIVWWRQEIQYIKKLSFSWKLILFVQKSVVWTAIGWGLVGRDLIRSHRDRTTVLSLLGLAMCFFLRNPLLRTFSIKWEFSLSTQRYQRWLVDLLLYLTLAYVYFTHARTFLYTVALYYFAMAWAFLLILLNKESMAAPLCKRLDQIIGLSVFAVLSLGALFQLSYIHSWLLFYNALSKDIPILSFLDRSRREFQANTEETLTILSGDKPANAKATSETDPLLSGTVKATEEPPKA